jgi:2-polyprenyl-6-methoxyphenol hydroxylase-like FAD-dependent oxidoreductase
MSFEIVGRAGPLAGKRFPVTDTRTTFGRKGGNSVVLSSLLVSRFHAEILREADDYVLHDLESSNGTLVNGKRVTSQVLQPGDLITIGDETLCFEVSDATERITTLSASRAASEPTVAIDSRPVLNVTVSGGGPVGLSFALLLEHLMGRQVHVTVYDGRWTQVGRRIAWKDERQGNVRRQQVVTIQSRQYLNLPKEAQARLFSLGSYSEMWPIGPDSIRGHGPRNTRIAYVEDMLLEIANEKPGRIRLIPTQFDPIQHHTAAVTNPVLAICEGANSRTRQYFTDKFGNADNSIYSINGKHLQDVVLGLRVKSKLPDPMIVLLTVAQNRFLLNSVRGEGFLNMRLTDAEAAEVVGINLAQRIFKDCLAARPCVMGRGDLGRFQCPTHRTLFLPALIKGSALWQRVLDGLALFGIAEQDLSAVTAFRLDMVQRPRFTAQLYPMTSTTPGTHGFLLGDAANAIHFWPGRGLNSGLASAISLARCLNEAWRGKGFRDADFARHEAAMSMLQYRHKSRAWRAMVTTDDQGFSRAIKDMIAKGIEHSTMENPGKEADIDELMERLRHIRNRLSTRLTGLPEDATLRDHLRALKSETVRTLLASGAWETSTVGGEEVDIDMFYRQDAPVSSAA